MICNKSEHVHNYITVVKLSIPLKHVEFISTYPMVHRQEDRLGDTLFWQYVLAVPVHCSSSTQVSSSESPPNKKISIYRRKVLLLTMCWKQHISYILQSLYDHTQRLTFWNFLQSLKVNKRGKYQSCQPCYTGLGYWNGELLGFKPIRHYFSHITACYFNKNKIGPIMNIIINSCSYKYSKRTTG